MPIQVEYEGTVHEFPDDFTDADIAAALDVETPESRPDTDAMSASELSDHVYGLLGVQSPRQGAASGRQWMREHPVQAAATIAAPAVLGGVARGVMRYAPPIMRQGASALANLLDRPGVGPAVGAAEGYRQGGVEGALYGGALGATGSPPFVTGLRRLAQLGKPPMVPGVSRASSPVAGERNIDDMIAAAIAKQRKANPSGVFGDDVGVPLSPAPKPVTQRDALLEQVSMRDPDWRLVDAVPIKANQTKGIIEAGESRVGLAERAAQAAKTGDAEEVDRLLKALRQRMHISATRSTGQ